MKLPELKISRCSPAGKERLRRWLTEWEISLALRGPATEKEEAEAEPAGDIPVSSPFDDPAPSAGQIRLFPPLDRLTARRPLYAALLRKENGVLIAAPFGSFSEPAFEGELLTGREAGPLRVLCCWNSARLSHEFMKNSWLVDEMTGGELADALAVLEHVRCGSVPPEPLSGRIGPPCWHPADPRARYALEEREIMDSLAARDNSGGESLRYPLPETAWRMAAENRPKWGKK
ncbi:MAG: hypothetical protein R6V03_01885 [Kiritimatiellia bacterium]